MRYHLTPVRMAIIQKEKKNELTSVGEKLEKGVLLYTVGKNVNWCNTTGNSMKFPQKNKNSTII